MDKCQICGNVTETLYECESCHSLYCDDCGISAYLCPDCFELDKFFKSNSRVSRITNEFTFYKVIRSVDKGHTHFTFSVKTFCALDKAKRFASRQPFGRAKIIKIKTFPNGELKVSVVRI